MPSNNIDGKFTSDRRNDAEKYYALYKDFINSDITKLITQQGVVRKLEILTSLPKHYTESILLALESLVKEGKIKELIPTKGTDINYKINDQNRD